MVKEKERGGGGEGEGQRRGGGRRGEKFRERCYCIRTYPSALPSLAPGNFWHEKSYGHWFNRQLT